MTDALNNSVQMTPEQDKAIQDLREAGFSITIFHPQELGNADPKKVDNRLNELGVEVIDELSES